MSVFLASSIDIIFLSLVAGTGLTITCLKIFKTLALKYDYIFDLILTIGLPILFGSGFHAMAIALLSGIVVSVELFILKHLWNTSVKSNKFAVMIFIRKYLKGLYASFLKGLEGD